MAFCMQYSGAIATVCDYHRKVNRICVLRTNQVINGGKLLSSSFSTAGMLKGFPKRTTLDRFVRHATVDDIEAEKQQIQDSIKEKMEKCLENVTHKFNTVRTGRANPALLDRVQVDYYGALVPLRNIANITTVDGTTLMVQPFDKKSIPAIDKAIQMSDLGLKSSDDGNVIRLGLPQLTADRRKELQKVVKKLSEEGKIALRNVRRDGIKAYQKLEKDKKISEDLVNELTDDMQKLTDSYVKKVDDLLKQKEKELSTV